MRIEKLYICWELSQRQSAGNNLHLNTTYVHGVVEVLNDYPLAGSTLKRVETYSNLKRLMI